MAGRQRRYWLMKSEPTTFSLDDLERLGRTPWDGVRNYQARNFMRDEMGLGDRILFYHSNLNPPGVVGVAAVASKAHPDSTQFDPKSEYYDPKAAVDSPRWYLVDISFVQRFDRIVSLPELKHETSLANMLVVQRGCRLSVQPVERAHYMRVVQLGRTATGQ